MPAVAETLDAEAPSANYIDRCRAVLRAADDTTLRDLDEMTEDLTAYLLRYRDLGRPAEDAIVDWAAEWGLTGA